jgi:hypothetical protein
MTVALNITAYKNKKNLKIGTTLKYGYIPGVIKVKKETKLFINIEYGNILNNST